MPPDAPRHINIIGAITHDAVIDAYNRNQVPGPDFELQSGDVMLLVGKPEGLKKISET